MRMSIRILFPSFAAFLAAMFAIAGALHADESAAVKAKFQNPPREYSSGPLWV